MDCKPSTQCSQTCMQSIMSVFKLHHQLCVPVCKEHLGSYMHQRLAEIDCMYLVIGDGVLCLFIMTLISTLGCQADHTGLFCGVIAQCIIMSNTTGHPLVCPIVPQPMAIHYFLGQRSWRCRHSVKPHVSMKPATDLCCKCMDYQCSNYRPVRVRTMSS